MRLKGKSLTITLHWLWKHFWLWKYGFEYMCERMTKWPLQPETMSVCDRENDISIFMLQKYLFYCLTLYKIWWWNGWQNHGEGRPRPGMILNLKAWTNWLFNDWHSKIITLDYKEGCTDTDELMICILTCRVILPSAFVFSFQFS